jgi:hypothetical protein
MEHVSSALIFPDTEPSPHAVAKLLIFFDALSYYLPTESGEVDINFFSNLCTGYAPAPLGDDLSRFNRLLRELETSRPDEFSRLFSTAKAPVATGEVRDQDEISAATVYSALQHDADINTNIQYRERLWQARLVLKLAEILDRKETEVRQGLAQVSSAEHNVFAALEGHAGAETDDLADLNSADIYPQQKSQQIQIDEHAVGASELLIPLRAKAWAELYLADPSIRLPDILTTANPESGAILLDGYENTWDREPRKLFSLNVPVVNLTNAEKKFEKYLISRNTFREAAKKNLEYFAQFLQQLAGFTEPFVDNQKDISLLAENISAWEEKIKVHFSGAETDFNKISFYCFPGTSIADLFQRLFHLKGKAPANRREHQTGLLAILNP